MALEYRTISGSTGSPVEVVTRDGVQHADPIPVLSADDTLPPTPIEDLVAAAGLQVHVLAADTAVRDGVRRACGERYAFTVADDWTSLLAEIDARRCDIAVIEASLLGARLEKCITDLGRNGRQAVTLVAADRKEAQRLIGFLSERRIHRLLIKPPAAGITRLLIESAANRCLQLRSAAVASPPVVTAPKKAAARIPTWLIAAGVAVLCLAVALAVASYRAGSGRNAGVAADQAAAGAAAPIDRFADLVASAELAFSQGRLADPPGDNALDYYLNVLAAEPTHEKARDGLASVVDALFAQAENALLMGSLDAAATSLDAIRKTAPTSGRLAFLDAALARSRADAAKPAARGNDKAASAAPAATGDSSPAAQAEIEKVLDTASTRLRRGELLEPAGDSALRNLDRATQLAGNDPRVIRLRSELAAALISSARTALDAGDLSAGLRLADAARTLGADAGAMSVLDQKIAAARVTQQTQRLAPLVAKGRARIQAGALDCVAGRPKGFPLERSLSRWRLQRRPAVSPCSARPSALLAPPCAASARTHRRSAESQPPCCARSDRRTLLQPVLHGIVVDPPHEPALERREHFPRRMQRRLPHVDRRETICPRQRLDHELSHQCCMPRRAARQD